MYLDLEEYMDIMWMGKIAKVGKIAPAICIYY